MKRLFTFIASSLLLLSSCTESDIHPENEDDGLNYLVMLYGIGGGNLDRVIVSNIAQAIDESGSDKVAMTIEYKSSAYLQKDSQHPNFEGTRRFTIDDNAHLKGMFKSLSEENPRLDQSAFEYYMDNIKSEKIGDGSYDMSNADSLAAFIKWSKMKYPNAKRTILVITDHGSGWELTDGQAQLERNQTRSMFKDDNIGLKSLKAVDVAEGMSMGGGVDLLYVDACLMSMYENMYTYAKGARYLMASVETTPADGSDFRKLLSLLKTTGTSDAELEDAMRQHVDYCVSEEWWGKQRSDGTVRSCDLAIYDMSKLDAVTAVLKKTASTLAEKFVSTESIEPTETDLPLSDQFAPYIRKAMNQCVISSRNDYISIDFVPETLVPYINKDIPRIVDAGSQELFFQTQPLIDWIKYAPSDNAKYAYENYNDDWVVLSATLVSLTNVTYSLTDLMRQINEELCAVGAKNNPFAQLYDDLLVALKSMGHVACTEPVNLPGIDQAYELCSPGIFIAPFNETYISLGNPSYFSCKDYNYAQEIYQATDFDKAVGWSKFLKVLDMAPSLLFNPGRKDLQKELFEGVSRN